MDEVAKGELRYDEEVSSGLVQGHPDGRTHTQIFEVKMTGMLQENWQEFLYQVFAYAALTPPTVTDIYLVLPMQELLWHYDVREWTNRQAYCDLLNSAVSTIMENGMNDAIWGMQLRETCHIGSHIRKEKSLVDTVLKLGDYSKPYQIFLAGPQNSRMNISDDELDQTAIAVAATGAKIYVHSQYLINLCQPISANNGFHAELLIKNLQYAVKAGFKGVVVHVGKSTDKPLAEAVENMKQNLLHAMTHATSSCPILLETPAGQGTETLCKYNEFVEFVMKFNDPRLRICVDTCHVFACAASNGPYEYLDRLTTYNRHLLRLVHYNDSACVMGSCMDRHAFMGTGHIGVETMTNIAKLCHKFKVPMLIE
jgi:deoxyribonuclease-4